MDHATNTPLAYVFGTREHKYLEELLKLPEPFSIGTVYVDNHFAYSNKISDNQFVTGKKNAQHIERDHLTLRTRIKRLACKTICFSKGKEIHMALVGTFINLFFFRRPFDAFVFYDTTKRGDRKRRNSGGGMRTDLNICRETLKAAIMAVMYHNAEQGRT